MFAAKAKHLLNSLNNDWEKTSVHELRAARTHPGAQPLAPVGTSRSCQQGVPARVGSLHRAAWKSLLQQGFSSFSAMGAQGLNGYLVSSETVSALVLPCAEVCSARGTGLAGRWGLPPLPLRCLTKLRGSKVRAGVGPDLCAQASASQPAMRVSARDDVRHGAEPKCRRVRSN